jgi:chromosome segregation ATPase
MRSFLLFGKESESDVNPTSSAASATYVTVHRAPVAAPAKEPVAARVAGVESQMDESDYQTDKRFKEQYRTMAATQNDVSSLKSATAQLQTTTTGLPQQISQVGSQAEAKAGQALGDAAAARQAAQTVEQQLSIKLKELEGRTARASEEVGRVEAQASGIGTRTEKLETDIIGLTKQLEARTDELSNRTAKEREDQTARLVALQNIAFAGIVSELTASVDELERRVGSSIYRFFNKGEAQREADALQQRITALANELSSFTSDQAKQTVAQLEQLRSRIDTIAARVK